jgi:tetratricopeptide (TPR) repeat protein/ssDNA-binding Zn-finger/Zn-ribbon topoisomerase 1
LSRKKKRTGKPANTAARPQPTAAQPKSNRGLLAWLAPLALVSVVAVVLLARRMREPSTPSSSVSTAPPMLGAKFVGAAECASCHKQEENLWRGSHHQLAMQPAEASTVLGDFNRASFDNKGVTSSFFRNGSSFMVRTDGPDGALHDYEIKFTFGVYPLQQYLIAMPGGRLQGLGIAWDTRPRERGGQRWFFLYPGEKITARDTRHWTGIDQNWNYMCADCHSTDLRKNYNAASRTFSTSYSEIDVSCEACHGPGSNHLAWAKKQGEWEKFDATEGLAIALDERKGVAWAIDLATGNARRSSPRTSEREIEMCARCHARRGEIHEDYVHGQPVGDDYRVALLDEDHYFPDGQIKEEDYEYGSFTQSKMFHAGVTCSDCHEPHGLKLRADGNNVCAQCHSAQKYDSPSHHFHQVGSAGARCVECHMPTRTYMVIDARRDHSIRIPRPDLSVKLGTPNACTNCHSDKSAEWALDTVKKWYGHAPEGFQHFAEALDAGTAGAPGANQSLERLVAEVEQPAIARATALSLLASYSPAPTDAAVRAGVVDDWALVRRAAARAMSNTEPSASANAIAPLLSDPVRAVRIEAAEVLAGLPSGDLPANVADAFDRATDEYVSAQQLNADRPEAHLNLGLMYARQNYFDKAEKELKTALSLDPSFAPAAVNLADVYRAQNRDEEGKSVLKDALGRSPDDASLEHALGLLMVRQKRSAQALDLLAAAARNDPGNARYVYVYAVALNRAGKNSTAIETLESSIKAHPYDRDSLAALVSFLQQAGDNDKALTYAERLEELEPDNPQVQQMLKELREHPHG